MVIEASNDSGDAPHVSNRVVLTHNNPADVPSRSNDDDMNKTPAGHIDSDGSVGDVGDDVDEVDAIDNEGSDGGAP
eukprot:2422031-Heterocapsa_arctica.AAC.1